MIEPTAKGVAVVAALDASDANTIAAISADLRVSRAELAAAIRVLRAVRDAFEVFRPAATG